MNGEFPTQNSNPNIWHNLRRNAVLGLAVGSLASFASGCGANNKDLETSLPETTKTVYTNGPATSASKKGLETTVATASYLDFPVISGDQLDEIAEADLQAAGTVSPTNSEIDQMASKIESLPINHKLQRVAGSSNLEAPLTKTNGLQPGPKLYVPGSVKERAAFNQYLTQAVDQTTSGATYSHKVDGKYFEFSVQPTPVTAKELGPSWHQGCPLAPSQISQVELSYINVQGQDKKGTMDVATTQVTAIKYIFAKLFYNKFPISQITPLSSPKLAGRDNLAVKQDDTFSLDCAKTRGASAVVQFGLHASAQAVDVNPRENDYKQNGKWYPNSNYANRSQYKPGMAMPLGSSNDSLTAAFASQGYGWGGNFPSYEVNYHYFYSEAAQAAQN